MKTFRVVDKSHHFAGFMERFKSDEQRPKTCSCACFAVASIQQAVTIAYISALKECFNRYTHTKIISKQGNSRAVKDLLLLRGAR